MRILPSDFAADLARGVTTHCACWKVTRRDGVVLGFTDHDGALAFDGVAFEPNAGFTPSDARATSELSVDASEALGALSSERITEADIARGLYDGAAVEVWRVDWRAPERRAHLQTYEIAEIRLKGAEFVAELRGPAAKLDRVRGRLHRRRCDARLGDARCGVDLETPAFRVSGTVSAVEDLNRFVAAGLEAFEVDHFSLGRFRWETGANAGLEGAVRAHGRGPAGDVVVLDASPLEPVAAGDGFTLWAGCDKALSTCRDKFANSLNFRGFPYLPNEDEALRPLR